jgi:hypothetical protein
MKSDELKIMLPFISYFSHKKRNNACTDILWCWFCVVVWLRAAVATVVEGIESLRHRKVYTSSPDCQINILQRALYFQEQ